MATSIYASLREKFPTSVFSVSATSGGSTTTGGSIGLRLSARNRAGKNIDSDRLFINWTSGQKVVVTLNATARATGEDIYYYYLSGETTGDADDAVVLAQWQATDSDQETLRSLPDTVELESDNHLTTNRVVSTASSLPATAINGAIFYVSDESKYYQYDEEATTGTYANSPGYWVQVFGNSSYLTSTVTPRSGTQFLGGCDQPVAAIPSTDETFLFPPAYDAESGGSTTVKLWLLNGLDEGSGSLIPQGSWLDFLVSVNGNTAEGGKLSGMVAGILRGYVRRSTGVLDTSVPTVGASTTWILGDDSYLFTVPQSVSRGYAIAVDAVVSFRSSQFSTPITDGDIITILLREKGIYGTRDTGGYYLGQGVFDTSDKLRIYPALGGIIRGGGNALIGNGTNGYFTFPLREAETFTFGIEPDIADQQVCISGSLAGDVAIRQPSAPLLDTEALRALISTASGTANASGWSNSITLGSSQVLQLVVGYPCDADGKGTIRVNYPDSVLQGATLGDFNPVQLRVFVRVNSGTITEIASVVVSPGVSQTLTISSLSGGTVVGSLPSGAASDFNLWGYGTRTLSAVSGSGSLTSGASYEVAIAYHYPSPNSAITAISHSVLDGCIPELAVTFSDAIANMAYWGVPIVSFGDLATTTPDVEQTVFVIEKIAFYTFSPSGLIGGADNGDSVVASGGGFWNQIGSVYWLDPMPTKSLLKSLASASLRDGEVRGCLENYALYIYYSALGEADDGDTVLVPDDATGAEGWKKISGSGSGSGHVIKVNGTSFAQRANLNFTGAVTGSDDSGNDQTNIAIAGVTATIGAFTMPAVSGTVSVTATSGNFQVLTAGAYVYISTAGFFKVDVTPSSPYTSVNLLNEGTTGNASPTTSIASGQLLSVAGKPGANGAAGSNGSNGADGLDAYTTTTANFTIPVAASTVAVSVVNSDWMAIGQYLTVGDGTTSGVFQVSAIASTTSITLLNPTAESNPSGTINSGAIVTPSGRRGATGATGAVSAASYLDLVEQSSDPAAVSGSTIVYSKTDHKVYKRVSAGTISELGAGASTTGTLKLRCTLTSSVAIATVNNTEKILNWDTEEYDPDGLHSTSTNTSRINIDTSGTYCVTGVLAFAANSSGYRISGVKINGSTYKGEHRESPIASSGISTTIGLPGKTFLLAAGDYLEIYAQQDSGSNLNILVSPSYLVPQINLWQISP